MDILSRDKLEYLIRSLNFHPMDNHLLRLCTYEELGQIFTLMVMRLFGICPDEVSRISPNPQVAPDPTETTSIPRHRNYIADFSIGMTRGGEEIPSWTTLLSPEELTPECILSRASPELLGAWLECRTIDYRFEDPLPKVLFLISLGLADKDHQGIIMWLRERGVNVNHTWDLHFAGFEIKLNRYLEHLEICAALQPIPSKAWSNCLTENYLAQLSPELFVVILQILGVVESRALIRTCRTYYSWWKEPSFWEKFEVDDPLRFAEMCIVEGLEVPLDLILTKYECTGD